MCLMGDADKECVLNCRCVNFVDSGESIFDKQTIKDLDMDMKKDCLHDKMYDAMKDEFNKNEHMYRTAGGSFYLPHPEDLQLQEGYIGFIVLSSGGETDEGIVAQAYGTRLGEMRARKHLMVNALNEGWPKVGEV